VFIFPNSLLKTIRKDIQPILGQLSEISHLIAIKTNRSCINEKIQQGDLLFANLKDHMNIIKYEPIIHLSKRTAYLHTISDSR